MDGGGEGRGFVVGVCFLCSRRTVMEEIGGGGIVEGLMHALPFLVKTYSTSPRLVDVRPPIPR